MKKRILALGRYLKLSGFRKESSDIASILEEITGISLEETGGFPGLFDTFTTIQEGDRDSGTDGVVSEIQRMLEGHGYMLSRFGIDGIFGPETKTRVLEFQGSNNLSGSGLVDEETFRKLKSSFASGPRSVAPAGPTSYEPGSGEESGRVSEAQLYADLMARLSNPNLCIAMVANAIAESGLKPGIAGDCGDYANRHPDKSVNIEGKGQCCSFGLWQYNICGGMGIGYLEANGNPSDAEGKMRVLSDYNLQVDYMTGKLQSRYSSDLAQDRSVDEWVDWFVRNIERPANADHSVTSRQEIARGLSGLNRESHNLV